MKEMRFLLFVLICLSGIACHRQKTLFELIPASRSGIDFNNRIEESDSINPLSTVNIYNGGGVGIGDFNNDGLPDIYFSGNMVSGRLYLNKGKFHFEDITAAAGVEGFGRWGRGVAVVDINADGLPDIYLCNTLYSDSLRRRNILYLNQGPDEKGIPHFKNMAAEYGLEAGVQSTMASFFDYDNDGDLDLYLTVNAASNQNDPTVFRQVNRKIPSVGRLYRNDFDSSLHHAVFRDVSAAAGIKLEGFGHAASICDINGDGWQDIYVSDDFLGSNILYINNHDGTFTDQSRIYFKHTSYNAMGQDIADINNDGLPDVVELDMNPADNFRKKMMLAPANYEAYQNFDVYGYQYQYVRNTLQLNQGPRPLQNDVWGPPAFSEIGFMTGMSQTDWSWTPLLTDFDNDGYRDLVVTNGFPRDVTDHDFIAYRQQTTGFKSTGQLLEQIPKVKIHSYAFRNTGDLGFTDETKNWGLDIPAFSNGAAYADFDGDGAMDMIVNNINDQALFYRNTLRDEDSAATHFLNLRFHGPVNNPGGLGAHAKICYAKDRKQVYDNNPYRGYLSTMEARGHFGLGKTSMIDSVVISWTNGYSQTLKAVKADQTITVDIKDAVKKPADGSPARPDSSLFREVTAATGVRYRNYGTDFIDFGIQSLLPHKFTEYCPAVAAGDLDGNGFDDMIVGGDAAFPAQLLLQQADGRFEQKEFPVGVSDPEIKNNYKDEGILIFDANGDGHPDIYCAAGGYRLKAGDAAYQDRFYLNDGHGHFQADTLALPVNHLSKICVRSIDYNRDGRPDLFVSGRVDPWNYPRPVSSFIFRNDSRDGVVRFTDVTDSVAPALKNIGMICDALVTDFDGDGRWDLLLAGEWMPVCFLKNTGNAFTNVTAASGVANMTGWWNSICGGDFRHTGRTDYIIGNTGLNSLYQASGQYPVTVTAKKFDTGNPLLPVLSLYLPDSAGQMKSFPAAGRDEISRQFPIIKKRYPNYRSFARATTDDVLTPEQREGSVRLTATMLQSCFLRNDGNGKFALIPLPRAAQEAPLNGMLADDFDGDGNLDVLICGNDYGTDVSIGRYDAMNGLLLKGDGTGHFQPMTLQQSGFYVPGNAKALVKLKGPGNRYLVAASQNRDSLKLFSLRREQPLMTPAAGYDRALIAFRDGKTEKREMAQGSFLSQSAAFLLLNNKVSAVKWFDRKGDSVVHQLSPGQHRIVSK